MAKYLQRSIDKASQQMLKQAEKDSVQLAWDRLEAMQPQCGFGELGICCRNCSMGPCRIDPFGEGPQAGVCGANADTIVARNLLGHIAVGAAAHSDHGRDVAHTLALVGSGEAHDYGIADRVKLIETAGIYGIPVEGKTDIQLAKEVAEKALAEFGQQHGELKFPSRAPKKRLDVWRKLGIVPRGIDREIVESLHRIHMGVDNDYKNIILHGLRCSLGDGWGGSMIATDLQDIMLGSPAPIRSKVNLGVLKEDHVNVVVHGHEPTLSEMALKAASDPELIKLAQAQGAEGINLVGMCCTANEILMRHGIHTAGNFLQQELAIMTGSVELMMVDVQCIMPALTGLASSFHTEIVTTSPKLKFPGVTHIEFKEERAFEIAKSIIKRAVGNYKKRDKSRVNIPKETMDLVAGFTAEQIKTILGGRFRATYRPLNDAIISGRIRGIGGVVGCNNPKIKHDWAHIEMVKELIKNDVIVLQTGCSAIACAKAGLMTPEAALEFAGPGLREVCETVGIPPVLHVGSCVDNSRILIAAAEVVKEGGLGEDISDLPAAGAAPEWMSQKAISIGMYFVASGVFTVFGGAQPVLGSKNVTDYICGELEDIVGGRFAFEEDPIKAAHLMIEHIDKKRAALKLKKTITQISTD
ncbi:MAG: anaerobic carbon-monoxide dehydrogenase catalytic subunit [Candidatus Omnitrophica bacterium]|nr:anaerobic carbon-monoxide dehydrogenase catalytic subunit [Candidatus Omnitrophota bacterium]